MTEESYSWQMPVLERCYAAVRVEMTGSLPGRGPLLADVLGLDREHTVMRYRKALCLALRLYSGWSWPELGRALRRNHTTVLSNARSALKDDRISAAVGRALAKLGADNSACTTDRTVQI